MKLCCYRHTDSTLKIFFMLNTIHQQTIKILKLGSRMTLECSFGDRVKYVVSDPEHEIHHHDNRFHCLLFPVVKEAILLRIWELLLIINNIFCNNSGFSKIHKTFFSQVIMAIFWWVSSFCMQVIVNMTHLNIQVAKKTVRAVNRHPFYTCKFLFCLFFTLKNSWFFLWCR